MEGAGGAARDSFQSRGTRKRDPFNFLVKKAKKSVAAGATARGSYLIQKGLADRFCRVCREQLRPGSGGNWAASAQRGGRYICRPCKQASRRATVNGRLSNALTRARGRARRRGLPGTVTLRDLLPLPTVCPLLGIPLHYGPKNGPGKATFDRIDPTRGYEPGNVWIVSARANTIKNDASIAELKTLAANLEFHVRLVKPE